MLGFWYLHITFCSKSGIIIIMSRSYKRNPVYKPPAKKCNKRAASKMVRKCNTMLVQKGNAYRKLFESWDIHDYRMWLSLENYLEDWQLYFHSKDAAIQQWKKYYRRK